MRVGDLTLSQIRDFCRATKDCHICCLRMICIHAFACGPYYWDEPIHDIEHWLDSDI